MSEDGKTVEFAVIETRKSERLVRVSSESDILALEGQRREGDVLIYQSQVPVVDGKRIDGGRWPL